MQNESWPSLVDKPLEFMEARYLYPIELAYELELRGIANPHLLEREVQVETLDRYQFDEMASGTAPDKYCDDVQRDFKYIQDALRALEPITRFLPNVTHSDQEATRARLIHLHNRARRIAPKTRGQYETKDSIVKAVVAAQYLWRPTHEPSTKANHQSTPENQRIQARMDEHSGISAMSESANNTQLARQPTPDAPTRSVRHPPNTQEPIENPNAYRQLFPQEGTYNWEYEDDIRMPQGPNLGPPNNTKLDIPPHIGPAGPNIPALPSALKGNNPLIANERNNQIRFADPVAPNSRPTVQPEPQEVQLYLNDMAQTYSHAAGLFEGNATKGPISSTRCERLENNAGVSRVEHQELVNQLLGLQETIRALQLRRDDPQPTVRPVGSNAIGNDPCGVPLPLSTVADAIACNRQPEMDPENTVYRYGNTSTRFASRKQISPDHWGFCFSG